MHGHEWPARYRPWVIYQAGAVPVSLDRWPIIKTAFGESRRQRVECRRRRLALPSRTVISIRSGLLLAGLKCPKRKSDFIPPTSRFRLLSHYDIFGSILTNECSSIRHGALQHGPVIAARLSKTKPRHFKAHGIADDRPPNAVPPIAQQTWLIIIRPGRFCRQSAELMPTAQTLKLSDRSTRCLTPLSG